MSKLSPEQEYTFSLFIKRANSSTMMQRRGLLKQILGIEMKSSERHAVDEFLQKARGGK